MLRESFNHLELTAIKLAADRVAATLGAFQEDDRLEISRAVFEVGARTGILEPDRLAEVALETLKSETEKCHRPTQSDI